MLQSPVTIGQGDTGRQTAENDRYFLTTQRLGFRRWTPEDVALAVGLWANAEVARFIFANVVPSAAAAEERLAREIATHAEHRFQYWPIFLREGGAHVGCCGLRPYQPEKGIHELGV